MADSFSTTKYSGNELSVTANLVTMKSVMDVVLTPETVTEIFPVVVFAGTIVEIEVEELLVTVAAIPLRLTMLLAFTLLKPVPFKVIVEPTTATAGENEVMVSGSTRNSEALCTVIPSRTTLILPVVAPVGTFTVRLLGLVEVTVSATPLNLTTFSKGTLLKPLPVIVNEEPAKPLTGAKDRISNAENF